MTEIQLPVTDLPVPFEQIGLAFSSGGFVRLLFLKKIYKIENMTGNVSANDFI